MVISWMRDRAILYILAAVAVIFAALAYGYFRIAEAGYSDALEFVGICYIGHYPETAALYYGATGVGLVFLTLASAEVWRRGKDWRWLGSGLAAVVSSFVALLVVPYYIDGAIKDVHDGFATTMFFIEFLVSLALAWILHRDIWVKLLLAVTVAGMILSAASLLDFLKLMFTGQLMVQVAFCFLLMRGIYLLDKLGMKKRR